MASNRLHGKTSAPTRRRRTRCRHTGGRDAHQRKRSAARTRAAAYPAYSPLHIAGRPLCFPRREDKRIRRNTPEPHHLVRRVQLGKRRRRCSSRTGAGSGAGSRAGAGSGAGSRAGAGAGGPMSGARCRSISAGSPVNRPGPRTLTRGSARLNDDHRDFAYPRETTGPGWRPPNTRRGQPLHENIGRLAASGTH